ncbi:beta-1,4-galactosyltransferase 1, partial [Aplysia californica]|uniref:Beta-1,4-galactosyltransferase 1 n=1 Tax=Aplysia californica TaxID=6500 RepID=A0ABM1A4Q2_APLCA
MDRCSKFKVFNLLIVFCVVNFFIYRIYSSQDTSSSPTPSATRAVAASLHGNNTHSSNNGNQATGNAIGASSSTITTLSVGQHTSSQILATVSNVTGGSTNVTGKAPNSTSVGPGASSGQLPLCPLVPPNLNGPLATYSDAPEFAEIAKQNAGLRPGGRYSPPDCTSRHRVAIVIPYRNREHHLKVFLHNLHPMLRRQQLDYGIYVVDQALPGRFNRAMLMNIGYTEAMKRYNYQCAVFHDVDLIPENDRNIYSCPEQPRHLSAAIDKFKYR